MNIDQKISGLRKLMQSEGIDAYIVPTSDPHQSEYPADHWKSREWISGFTGSAGTVVVTQEHAGLWTDSRYFLQGEEQLKGSSMVLHKMYNQFGAGYINWITENCPSHSIVAVDGPLIALGDKKRFEKQLSKKDIQLLVTRDLINDAWQDRPGLPKDAVFEHDVKFAGKSRKEKLAEIRTKMKTLGAGLHLVTTLDDIAWIYNLRGNDVEFNPVFVAYTLIAESEAILFIDDDKLSDSVKTVLQKDNITLMPYDAIEGYLVNLTKEDRILVDESTISVYLYDAIKNARIIQGELISRHLKAVKNATELELFNQAMIKDGIALTHAFSWLEETLKERNVSEFEFSNKLASCRAAQMDYYGESFAAIIGYKGNGAIIHYRPMKDSCAEIRNEGILLADSGGQYYDGTTDITRTVCFSEPTVEERNAYTRVLKGHIALAKAIFPEGTGGGQLDILARKALWEDGKNYLHGTGHGIGFFLNVHEPPQGFAPGTSQRASTVHKVGMVTSNEPGYYKEGAFGIRIENLVVGVASKKEGFIEFETITLFPIETKLIDKALMDSSEIKWLNDYHQMVVDRLSPGLDDKHKSWLLNKCAAI